MPKNLRSLNKMMTQQQPPSLWRQILRQNFRELEPLATFLELNQEQRDQLLSKPRFSINIPLRLAEKMQKGSLDDPLVKQFLPSTNETLVSPAFFSDPVSDAHFRKSPKLLHKYDGRALLVCTSACAMHCRYCFRQNFDYDQEDKSFDEELKLVAADSSITELILSGGDPLSLSDLSLQNLFDKIQLIPHIKRVRFHTRFPIGIPERIDESFINLIRSLKTQVWFVIHVNHPNELDQEIFSRLKELQKIGCVILNQSVLLKGVNDDVTSLKTLFETLVNHGVLPYYLHQLDRVQGAAHFEVETDKGMWLIKELAKQLPGYAIPKYVREVAGELNKTPILF
jgi:EF-P beta-lysylation protein EpmB